MTKYWLKSVAIWTLLTVGINGLVPLVEKYFGGFWTVLFAGLALIGLLFAGKLKSSFERNEDTFEGIDNALSSPFGPADIFEFIWLACRLLFYPLYGIGAWALKGSDWVSQKVASWLVGIAVGYWLLILYFVCM